MPRWIPDVCILSSLGSLSCAAFMAALAFLNAAYLFLAKCVKRLFYRHLGKRSARRPPSPASTLAKDLERL